MRPERRRVSPSRCTSFKLGYVSYEAARDAAEQAMELGDVKPGCHVMPYECDECTAWHIANKLIRFKDA